MSRERLDHPLPLLPRDNAYCVVVCVGDVVLGVRVEPPGRGAEGGPRVGLRGSKAARVIEERFLDRSVLEP